MITHEEALELVKILYFNINEKTNQELNRTSKIYDKLDNYIAQQKKKEKLLELYKELIILYKQFIFNIEIGDYKDKAKYYKSEIYKIKQRIKELENEWEDDDEEDNT